MFGVWVPHLLAGVLLYRQLPAAKAAPLKHPFTPKYLRSAVISNPDETHATRVRGHMLLLDNAAKESRLKKDRDAKKVKVCAAKERKKLGVLGRRQCTTRGMGLWGFNESQTKSIQFSSL